MSINFITYDMLNQLILKNLHRIPHDIDVVVGVPRSGLIVANMIACYLNKPLTDVAGVIAGKLFEHGLSKKTRNSIGDFSGVKKILVVEDSVDTGNLINNVKNRLAGVTVEKIFLSAIVAPRAIKMVDLYFAVVPQPRMFEWNYMQHSFLKHCCLDFDGVLCQDPTPEQNDDGENYRHFILNAAPKFIPSISVGYIVTSRLQKYSEETRFWLRRYNIQYEGLIMLNLESAEQRRTLGIHAKFKAKAYSLLNETVLFIESEPYQAQEIAQLTNKDVFCVANSVMYRGSDKF